MHYHHILPVPEEADKTWFDERFVKEAENPEGIVRVGKTSLLHYVECMDEPMEQLFWAGGETLRQIYEEEMVGTLEWVGLQSDFDRKPVSYLLSVCCLTVMFWIRFGFDGSGVADAG